MHLNRTVPFAHNVQCDIYILSLEQVIFEARFYYEYNGHIIPDMTSFVLEHCLKITKPLILELWINFYRMFLS